MIPTFHMGHGGALKYGAGSTASACVEWKMTKKSRIAETTHSGSSGWRACMGTVKEATITATILWDSMALPEMTSLDCGDSVLLDLEIGDSSLQYADVPVVIESLEISVNNQNGVVMYNITAQNNGVVPDPSAIA